MANLYRQVKNAVEQTSFRYVQLIEQLSKSQLESHGYYSGYACPHGHTIRDAKQHWCYFCVKKILSNNCGFDINFLHNDYKVKYSKLWKRIEVSHPEDCWTINASGTYSPKRVCMPSYRAAYSHQKSENVTIHKALYQCAWGDVGALIVTRACGNPKCGNPLHMVSSWNRAFPPEKVHPFEMEFKAEKLMQINRARLLNREQEIITQDYKQTITHPLDVKEVPDYDEGG
jgi:hypothetical protein